MVDEVDQLVAFWSLPTEHPFLSTRCHILFPACHYIGSWFSFSSLSFFLQPFKASWEMRMKLIGSLIHLLPKYLLTCLRAEQDIQGVFTRSHITSASAHIITVGKIREDHSKCHLLCFSNPSLHWLKSRIPLYVDIFISFLKEAMPPFTAHTLRWLLL